MSQTRRASGRGFEKRAIVVCLLLLGLASLFILIRLAGEREDETPNRVATNAEGVRSSHDTLSPPIAGTPRAAKPAPSVETTVRAPATDEPPAIAGLVKDESWKPIGGASVFLLPDWLYDEPIHAHHAHLLPYLKGRSLLQTTTGADGRYLFSVAVAEFAGKNFTVVGFHPGRSPAECGISSPNQGRSEVDDLVLLSLERFTFFGVVTDDRFNSIPGATVRVFCNDYEATVVGDTEQAEEEERDRELYPDGICGTSTMTDGGGQYRLELSSDFDLNVIEAWAPGYVRRRFDLSERMIVDRTALVDFELGEGGSVRGKVVDENGLPLRARIDAQYGTKSGCTAMGEYRLDGLPRGVISLWATCEGYDDVECIVEIGTTGEVNFTLRKLPLVTISGRVVDGESNVGLNDAYIDLATMLGHTFTFGKSVGTETDENGGFTLTCPAKVGVELLLGISRDDYVRARIEVPVPATLTVRDLRIALEKATRITVRLKDAGSGSPIVAKEQRAEIVDDRGNSWSMKALIGIPRSGTYMLRARALGYRPAEQPIQLEKGRNHDVEIALQEIGEGTIHVEVNAPDASSEAQIIVEAVDGNWDGIRKLISGSVSFSERLTAGEYETIAFVKGTTMFGDGTEIFRRRISIQKDKETKVEIVLPDLPLDENRFVRLSGEIAVNGIPFSGAILFPSGTFILTGGGPPTERGIPTTRGRYVASVKPGEHDWELLKNDVTIARGSLSIPDVKEFVYDIRLNGRRIGGTVKNAAGTPVPLADVELEGNDISFSAMTDSRGLFAFDGVPDGAYVLGAHHDDARAIVPIFPIDRDNGEIALVLRPDGVVRLNITGMDGQKIQWDIQSDSGHFDAWEGRGERVFGAPAGEYSIVLQSEGYMEKRIAFTINERETTTIDVVLEPRQR
ncbi:MAG: hypothetical protein A2Z34_09800 [Planctomycetes bacterium RBG_16_59_8]|nr:MAG: hypothetical protein A2Z34_09800 [Planctomycetes bacterium RBG_16_59_8]